MFLLISYISQILEQISDLKNKVSEHHEKLQDLNNTIECVQQTVNTEIDRLECINNESRLLEVKENDLQNTINEKETELNKIITGIVYLNGMDFVTFCLKNNFIFF